MAENFVYSKVFETEEEMSEWLDALAEGDSNDEEIGALRAVVQEQYEISCEAIRRGEVLEEALREIARGGYDETTCQMFATAALARAKGV